MRPAIEESAFNALEWRAIDGEKIDEALTGATVIGAEPVDYPETDGLIIYLRGRSGAAFALEAGAEYDFAEEGENPFYTRLAVVPLPEDPDAPTGELTPEVQRQIAATVEAWYNSLTVTG